MNFRRSFQVLNTSLLLCASSNTTLTFYYTGNWLKFLSAFLYAACFKRFSSSHAEYESTFLRLGVEPIFGMISNIRIALRILFKHFRKFICTFWGKMWKHFRVFNEWNFKLKFNGRDFWRVEDEAYCFKE